MITLTAARGGALSAIVLTVEDTDSADADVAFIASLSDADRVALLRREAACRQLLREAPCPVYAISDCMLSGPAAGLFLAASHRICTQRASFVLDGCHKGLCPGFGTLGAMAELNQPHVAMAVALGAVPLNAHDCLETGLATHFAPSDALPDLLAEWQAAPPEYLDVPLSRRTQANPVRTVPLYASDRNTPLNAALRETFGPSASDVPDALRRIERSRRLATEHARALANEPCGINIGTLERADTVADVLSAASNSLAPQSSCPVALATTWAVLRLLRRQRSYQSGGRDRDLELELELALDARLRARRRDEMWDDTYVDDDEAEPDCERALLTGDGSTVATGTASSCRERPGVARPAWRPSQIGEEALAIAGDIEAELAALLAS